MSENATYVLREGERVGPLTPESMRAEMAAGRLRGSDLAWRQGQVGWRPLAELVGGHSPAPTTACVPAPPPPPPVPGAAPTAFAPAPPPAPVSPRLWNARAAGRWGILLGPAVPAFVIWRNWRTLGESTRADQARLAFCALAFVQVVIQAARFFVGQGHGHGLTLLWIMLGAGYHYLGARPAAAAQQAARGAGVFGPNRPLWRPVLAGVGAQFAVAFVCLMVLGVWETIPDAFGNTPRVEVTAIPGPFGLTAAVLVTSHEEAPLTVRRVVANGHAPLTHKLTIAAGFMPGSEAWSKPAVLQTGESLGLHVEGIDTENLVRVRVETDRGAYECRFNASDQQ